MAWLKQIQRSPVSDTVSGPDVPTSVFLASFGTRPVVGGIGVVWETASELNTLGFHLYRSDEPDGKLLLLTKTLIPGQAPGLPEGAAYDWLDETAAPRTVFYYWLEAVDIQGGTTLHGPVRGARYPVYLPLVTR